MALSAFRRHSSASRRYLSASDICGSSRAFLFCAVDREGAIAGVSHDYGAANAQNSGIMHETSTLGRSEVRERVARLATAKLTYELAAKTSAANATSDRSAQNEILAIKAFKKAGCGLIETQTDALTYDK
jgi:hypothetical protein